MPAPRSAHAFTIPELLITLCIGLVVIYVFMMPAGGPRRPIAQRIKCINNLKNVGLAKRIFLNDNPPSDLSDDVRQRTTAAEYFRVLSNELSTPHILTCPNDLRVTIAANFQSLSNNNVSYFVNPTSSTNDVTAFFAGDRNLQTNGIPVPSGSILNLTRALELGWTKEMHNQQGNIAMNDGSVQQFDSSRLRAFVNTNSPSTQVLLIP